MLNWKLHSSCRIREWRNGILKKRISRERGLLRIKLIILFILMQKVMQALLGGIPTTIRLKEDRMLFAFGMKVALLLALVIRKMFMEVQKRR